MARMIKKRFFLKITWTTLLLPLHQLPVKLPPGDPAPEVHCFKVESCWGVKPNMPKQFSSAAAAMLVALSTNKYLSWKKSREFVSLKNSLKARWCHWQDAHVTWESHWHGFKWFNLDLKILVLWIPIHGWQVYSTRPESSLVVMMDISWTRIDALQWQCHQEAKEWHVDSLSMIRINYCSDSCEVPPPLHSSTALSIWRHCPSQFIYIYTNIHP